MSAVHIVERPAQYPGTTVWGRTKGPCAYMGELIRGQGLAAGVSVYLDEREFNEARAAFGYPSKEQVAELEERLADAIDAVNDLEAQVRDLEGSQVKVVSLAEALKSKPKPAPKKPVAA